MNAAASLPAWIAVPVILLLLAAGCLVLVGSFGLLRLSSFYQRLHGPAIANTLGAGCVLVASMLYFTGVQSRPVVHELLITVFVLLTAPVTTIVLMRAALYRDRRDSRQGVPPHRSKAPGAVDRRP